MLLSHLSWFNSLHMQTLRNQISPGLRGAFFYAAYWGAIGLYDPFLNVYFLGLGIKPSQIGWLAAVLPLCTLVIAPLVTRMADHAHRRVFLLASACLGFGLAITLPGWLKGWPGFQATFPFLLAFVALFALFRSPIVALADSLIAAMAVRHALEFGSMRLWGSFVYTLTACSLGLLWARSGFEAMFLVTGASFLPVILAALLLEEPGTPAQAAAHESAPTRGFVLDPGVLFLLGATFLIIAALFMAGNFGSIYMSQLGGSAVLVGAMTGISALGEVPGMLYGSRVARRLGDTNALLLAYALTAAGLTGYAFTHTPWVLLVFSVLRGIGFGQLLVSTVMIINNRSPHGLTATYQGILNAACWGLAPLLGGPISGWIFQNHGPAALFLTAAGLTLLATLLILPTYRIWGQDTRASRLC